MWILRASIIFVLALTPIHARVQSTTTSIDKIPKAVLNTLNSRFPNAKIDKWTREKEGGGDVYDLEFKQEGRKFEADIFADGTLDNWEREIAATELPYAVTKTVQQRYPKARIKEVMAITSVEDGKEALEGYEIVLLPAGKREVEITVSPDGRIVEAGG